MNVLQPPGWMQPRGYANGIVAEGRVVFVAGQIGWNADCEFETDDFAEQVWQALANVVAVLAEAGGVPTDIARMTWYITDKQEYRAALKEVGHAYRAVIGAHYPTMTLVQVAALLEDRAKVEIEATAVLPPVSTASAPA